jgi:2-polyprenyl-6-methoxyphenol hydroxylase-like FAD-dependent oxidoreductase
MYGVDTVLIDRSADIIDYPRAVGMDDECLRSFQGVGLADDLLPHVIQNVPLRFFDARQRCFVTGQPGTREFGWARRNIFLQQHCERVLRAGLKRYPSGARYRSPQKCLRLGADRTLDKPDPPWPKQAKGTFYMQTIKAS